MLAYIILIQGLMPFQTDVCPGYFMSFPAKAHVMPLLEPCYQWCRQNQWYDSLLPDPKIYSKNCKAFVLNGGIVDQLIDRCKQNICARLEQSGQQPFDQIKPFYKTVCCASEPNDFLAEQACFHEFCQETTSVTNMTFWDYFKQLIHTWYSENICPGKTIAIEEATKVIKRCKKG